MPMGILLPRFRINFDSSINPQNANTSLHSTLQTPDLAHTGLQHPRIKIIPDLPLCQIQSIEPVSSFLLLPLCSTLRGSMVCAKLGNEIGRIFGGVDGELFGDDEEGGGEFSDGELFPGANGGGKVFEID